jgi:hypothetical protein
MVALYALLAILPGQLQLLSIIAASLDLAALVVHKLPSHHHGFNTSMQGAAAVVGRLP